MEMKRAGAFGRPFRLSLPNKEYSEVADGLRLPHPHSRAHPSILITSRAYRPRVAA